jgi:methionyl-tRNA formyltransferase
MSVKNIAFLGRGDLGLDVLKGLLGNPSLDVKLIATTLHSAEVVAGENAFRALAEANGIPFITTRNINRSKWVELFRAQDLDLAVAMLWINTIGGEIIQTAKTIDRKQTVERCN